MYGQDLLAVHAENKNGRVRFTFEGIAQGLKLLLRNVAHIKDLEGARAEEHSMGLSLEVNEYLRDVTFTL